MSIKDRIVSWYVKNIVIPKIEEIDNPSYIIAKFSQFKEKLSLRELFLPESLFVALENRLKEKGYHIGKKFGYVNASISKFETLFSCKNKVLKDFIYALVRYVEGTWSNKLLHSVDLRNRTFKLNMSNYIICRKNGLGYMFSEGGIAGIWSYACQDPTIEAVQPKCQGRGDKECEVIAAPYDTLVEMGYKPMRCKIDNMEIPKVDETYMEMNKIRKTKWARNSLRSLIDSGFFEYHHGQVTYKGERFFLCEASFMYILERELAKVKNGLRILWDVSFDFGKRLAEVSGKQDPCKFIMDFFPALGFGDMNFLT